MAPPNPMPPFDPGCVLSVLSALDHLMAANTQRQDGKEGASVPLSQPKFASKAREGKHNRQGEGKKGCRACGWRLDGIIGLKEHRKGCNAYQVGHGAGQGQSE